MPHRRFVGDLPTPALLLDLDALEHNLDRMAERARALGVALRPHVKTHKCPEIGRMQLARGAPGVTVATLPEAVAFADAGFDDVTWAFPLVLARLDEVVALARRITFRVVVESEPALAALGAAARAAGISVHAWLEVDAGHHRSGVEPEAPASVDLARRVAAERGMILDGLLTHAGQSYHARTREERAAVAERERAVMAAFAGRLAAAGVPVRAVSVGSTPAMSSVRRLDGVSEIRPGNYAFYDYMQVAAGVCAADDCAVTVLASVVSHQRGADHAVVDAGALALSKDTGPYDPALARGFGPVLRGLTGHELDAALAVRGLSQEHGMVGGAGAADVEGRLAVGEKIRILPNHSCLTVAMFDEYQVVRGEEIVDRWAIRRTR
jgi:D-serine deaminase-like pyridoxal phosphate-dependent protein